MSTHSLISPVEAADRLAIRELVDAYAHCADRRDAQRQMSLFTSDAHFVVYMGIGAKEPAREYHSRSELAPVFEHLNTYEATTHFNGQSTISREGDRANGESYCLAHHVSAAEGKRTSMVASIRYHDAMVKRQGKWLFSERKLFVADVRRLRKYHIPFIPASWLSSVARAEYKETWSGLIQFLHRTVGHECLLAPPLRQIIATVSFSIGSWIRGTTPP